MVSLGFFDPPFSVPPDLPPDVISRFWHIIKYLDYYNFMSLGNELLPFIVTILCLYHSYKLMGGWKTLLFFSGSFFFSGLFENFWIAIGLFGIQPTYYFNFYNTFLWFGCIPIASCISWYYLAYCTRQVAKKVFPGHGIYFTSAIAGFIAMDIDLMIDPLMKRTGFWVWNEATSTVWILGIPFTNFIGWFLLIFVFAVIFEKISPLEEKYGRKKTTLLFIGVMLLCDLLLFGILEGLILLTTPIHGLQIPGGW